MAILNGHYIFILLSNVKNASDITQYIEMVTEVMLFGAMMSLSTYTDFSNSIQNKTMMLEMLFFFYFETVFTQASAAGKLTDLIFQSSQ